MRPIFIGGCPRSGTTLLGTVLGAHPECCPVPEAQFKVEALSGLAPDADRARAWRSLERVLRSHRFHGWKPAVQRVDRDTRDSAGSYAELIGLLARAYADWAGKPEATNWIDDTPSNKNFFPTLFRLFPDARAIHIVRDGRAVASSVMKRDWGPNTVWTAALWWVGHLSFGLAAEQGLPDSRIRRIRYEDLVRRPAETLRELCGWLGLEYSDRMLDSRHYTVDSRSATFNPLTRSAPRDDRAEAWRKELSARQVEIFEATSREMLAYLGYPMDYGPYARASTAAERARMGLAEAWGGASRSVAYRARRALWMMRADTR